MRIAIIKSNFTPYGGAEKYTVRLINAFAERNAEVAVLTSRHDKWSGLHRNVRQVILRQFRYNNLLRLLTFNHSAKKYLRSEKYDCILGMDNTEYQTHLRVGGGCHAAWIQRRCDESSSVRCLSFRINPFHHAMTVMEKRAFTAEATRRIICNSYLVKREIAHFYPQAEDKITVVHNGVQWEEFSDAFEEGEGNRDEILGGMGLQKEKFYFLFVGSGYERKGLDKAIRALSLLPVHTQMIVVGGDKRERFYKALSEKAGVTDRVHFFGPQTDVVPFLQISDAFVLPTIYDPFSNASLEALAMGLYTVTSAANGCAEVIKQGTGSIIGNLKDIGSVAETMGAALSPHLPKKEIRESVRHLDFQTQLSKIVDICISDTV